MRFIQTVSLYVAPSSWCMYYDKTTEIALRERRVVSELVKAVLTANTARPTQGTSSGGCCNKIKSLLKLMQLQGLIQMFIRKRDQKVLPFLIQL